MHRLSDPYNLSMPILAAASLLLGMRAVVLTVGETDPEVRAGVRALGADTVVTFARPTAEASALAAANGLRYIAYLSVGDVDRLVSDPDALRALRAVSGIAGFHYHAENVVEGYTTADDQRRAYGTLKALFPDALVLYAMRLDPIATDPAYLDGFFRPEFADLVAPYFYPVGTTALGNFAEDEAWETRLASLLAPLAARMPSGKGVLPVLQGFEQESFPVGPDFPARQLAAYRKMWPDARDVAAFWWGAPGSRPLAGLSQEPILARAFARLFDGLAPMPGVRAVAPRGRAPASSP